MTSTEKLNPPPVFSLHIDAEEAPNDIWLCDHQGYRISIRFDQIVALERGLSLKYLEPAIFVHTSNHRFCLECKNDEDQNESFHQLLGCIEFCRTNWARVLREENPS